MSYVMASLILILGILNIFQYVQRKSRDKDLEFLTEKLRKILEHGTMEQLLLITSDENLQSLLININKLLDEHQQKLASYNHSKLSMKKMLTNFSHDLKTPLTVVLGYIETIQNDDSIHRTEESRLLEQVHLKTLEIIELMNTFFDLAMLESGDREIPLTAININETCKNNLLSFYDVVQKKELQIELQLPDDPIYVSGNKEALDRVLHNLLSNAVRYGSDGKILGLNLTFDNNQVYLDVWDRGKGIEEQNQDQVFERMFTLDESRNKAFQGSGLGLSITKRLLEQMNGSVQVHSIPFDKTTFSVTLPRIIH